MGLVSLVQLPGPASATIVACDWGFAIPDLVKASYGSAGDAVGDGADRIG
jgi:hypothetical protein